MPSLPRRATRAESPSRGNRDLSSISRIGGPATAAAPPARQHTLDLANHAYEPTPRRVARQQHRGAKRKHGREREDVEIVHCACFYPYLTIYEEFIDDEMTPNSIVSEAACDTLDLGSSLYIRAVPATVIGPSPAMTDEAGRVGEQFRRRRVNEVLAMLVVLVAVAWAAETTYALPRGPLGSPAGWAALGVVLACFLFHVFNWRCPACGRYLGSFQWGMPSCRSCGTKLAADADRPR